MTIIQNTRSQYDCPDWCVRTDHYVEECEDGQHYHYAPNFGAVSIQTHGSGPFVVEIIEEQIDGLAGLLKHGRDVVSAAEWMAANA